MSDNLITFIIGNAMLVNNITATAKDPAGSIHVDIITRTTAPTYYGTILHSNEGTLTTQGMLDFFLFTNLIDVFFAKGMELNSIVVITSNLQRQVDNALSELLKIYPDADPKGDLSIPENKHLSELIWFKYWIDSAEKDYNPVIKIS